MTNSSKKSIGTSLMIAGVVVPFVLAQVAPNNIVVFALICPITFIVLIFIGFDLRRSARRAEKGEAPVRFVKARDKSS